MMSTNARWDGTLPVTHSEIATAGFTNPPETCAVTDTMMNRTRPCASATPVRSRRSAEYNNTAPAPMKISANVATNSAIAALPVLSKAPPRGCVAASLVQAPHTGKGRQFGRTRVVACLPWKPSWSRPTPRRVSSWP